VVDTRVSADKEGRELGVTRQSEDACDHIARRGYTLAEDAPGAVAGENRDNDRGASTRSRKTRPAFAAMLDAVRGGHVDVIVASSMSRITPAPTAGCVKLWRFVSR
jgi:DNA invertase Pin-like site-specific DNA recombinase